MIGRKVRPAGRKAAAVLARIFAEEAEQRKLGRENILNLRTP